MSTSSARHEAPRNGRPVKRRLIRVLAGSAVIGAMAVGGLQFALGTAYAVSDVCDLCSTNYNPVACCSSGGSAYDSNPGGGIDVSAQKAAFDSYCANYKKEHAQKEEPATPAPATKPSNPKQSAPAPAKQSSGSPAADDRSPPRATPPRNSRSPRSRPAHSPARARRAAQPGSQATLPRTPMPPPLRPRRTRPPGRTAMTTPPTPLAARPPRPNPASPTAALIRRKPPRRPLRSPIGPKPPARWCASSPAWSSRSPSSARWAPR